MTTKKELGYTGMCIDLFSEMIKYHNLTMIRPCLNFKIVILNFSLKPVFKRFTP